MSHASSLLALVILEMGVSQTIYLGCPQTEILQIIAFQVARITGVNHRCPARAALLNLNYIVG
jgi:hypothetical protein